MWANELARLLVGIERLAPWRIGSQMAEFDPLPTVARGQKNQEMRTFWVSKGYKVQGRIVTVAVGNGGGRARSILEPMRLSSAADFKLDSLKAWRGKPLV
ncbi:MAG: hypothetical protein WAU78_00610 [Roseiarcus sp.]